MFIPPNRVRCASCKAYFPEAFAPDGLANHHCWVSAHKPHSAARGPRHLLSFTCCFSEKLSRVFDSILQFEGWLILFVKDLFLKYLQYYWGDLISLPYTLFYYVPTVSVRKIIWEAPHRMLSSWPLAACLCTWSEWIWPGVFPNPLSTASWMVFHVINCSEPWEFTSQWTGPWTTSPRERLLPTAPLPGMVACHHNWVSLAVVKRRKC